MAKQCMLLAHCDVFERDAVLGLRNGIYTMAELKDTLGRLRSPDQPYAPDDSMVFDFQELADECNGELKAEQYWMVPVLITDHRRTENGTEPEKEGIPDEPCDDEPSEPENRFELTYVCTCGCVWNQRMDGTFNDRCPECDKEIEPHDIKDLKDT